MCKKPLACHNMLATDYIERILSEEVDTQLEELKGKQVSVCFDATPRMGDVFALIARYVETTAEGKYGRQYLGKHACCYITCNSSVRSYYRQGLHCP